MALEIIFTSGRKGSNPGGKIKVNHPRFSGDYYLKYCYGAKFNGLSSFTANHQPIYEALTFELVNFLGLSTTNYYVLCNEEKSLSFKNWKDLLPHDPSGRIYYFISKVSQERQNFQEEELSECIREDSPYLDLALVSDIVGKRQNYIGCWNGENKIKAVYLDLGCSFVYAKEGFLTLPWKARIVSPKELHGLLRELRNNIIQTKKGNIFYASDFVEKIPSLLLQTLNPIGRRELSDFLNEEETREIQGYLARNLIEKRKYFIESGIMA